jgi:polar amino acid transport system permease protein
MKALKPILLLRLQSVLPLAVVMILASFVPDNAYAAQGDKSGLMTLMQWSPFILEGFLLNLLMSAIAMVLATVFGVLLGLAALGVVPLIGGPARLVIQLLRNSPWIVVLFAIIFLIPFQVHLPGGKIVAIPDWWKATIGLSLPVMANIAEILRGAVLSIPSGQWESADSLAFSKWQTYRHVILPQCIKRMLPSWMNWYAMLTLSTPIASILGVQEAVSNTQAAMEAAGGRPDLLMPFYAFILILFFCYIYPVSMLTRRLERRFAQK